MHVAPAFGQNAAYLTKFLVFSGRHHRFVYNWPMNALRDQGACIGSFRCSCIYGKLIAEEVHIVRILVSLK
jgi:hypothetical protein